MRYTRGLFAEQRKMLEKKSWYHQRFDGCPYFIGVIAESELKYEERKGHEGTGSIRLGVFRNHTCDWYIVTDDLEKTTKFFLCKAEPGYSKKLMKKWEEEEKEFYSRCLEIKQMDLSDLDDEELENLHNGFMDLYQRKVRGSSIIDGFALGSDCILAEMIHERLKELGRDKEFPNLFSKLTAPVHQSFINEAEISLFRVAVKMKKSEELVSFIRDHDVEEIIAELENYPAIAKALDEHQRNYFWSKNNYVADNVLDIGYFVREIKEMLTEGVDPSSEIDKILSAPIRHRQDKEQLFRELGIQGRLKDLIHTSEDFTHWQDERKKSTFWATHYFSIILKEIGARVGADIDQLKYMMPFEVCRVFQDGLPDDIDDRLRATGFVWLPDDCEALVGEDVDKLIKVIENNKNLDVSEVKGLTACMGYAKGRVKICRSATEVGKVQKGDVLVAIMTRPDYVAGMKRASAIVTEEGGVTCHAAIVSRELGTPCVIGTKNATSVLKEGEMVEVIADEGLVRKIDPALS